MIAHTVYKGTSNPIVVELLSAGEALEDPGAISRVKVCVGGVEEDSNGEHVDYEDGVVTLRLGMSSAIQALSTGAYKVDLSAYETDTPVAFDGLMIILRDWC